TEFRYGITLYEGNAATVKKAKLFNTAPTFVIENNHDGTLKTEFSGLTCDAENIVVSAIKRSEDGKGLVLRAYETDGKETKAVLGGGLLPVPLAATFKPYSVDTYFLPDGEKEWKYVLMTEMEA
ncbi:MAG: alpha-mannosidase, partial [Clostridia bacterium]|nr:alpha-mannosidase [Clostridia bacterium]